LIIFKLLVYSKVGDKCVNYQPFALLLFNQSSVLSLLYSVFFYSIYFTFQLSVFTICHFCFLLLPFVSFYSHFSLTSRYVHRVGRTARAGCGGRAVTFVGDARRKVMKDVLKGDGDESTGESTVSL
jgi:hypothetical protein